MRYIQKGPEPRSLLQHRLTPHATYDNLRKDEVREQLAREQGFICCYCMQRISNEPDGMKIEHWAPQGAPATSHRELDWKILLGACKGNEGAPGRDQHCDSRKGETPITINPTERRCEQLVRFLADGTIESDDPAVQVDLNETLNLNFPRLKNNRRAVLDAFRQFMQRKYSGVTWSSAALEQELAGLQQPSTGGMLQPYCQVSVYWLKKRLGMLGRSPH
jgi:uncharacterized protein (TIGR02646 family)